MVCQLDRSRLDGCSRESISRSGRRYKATYSRSNAIALGVVAHDHDPITLGCLSGNSQQVGGLGVELPIDLGDLRSAAGRPGDQARAIDRAR